MTAPALTRDFRFDLDGYGFGCGTTVEVTDLDLGTADTRSQDADLDGDDARLFGRDRRTPATWSFVLTVKEPDRRPEVATARALATLGGLQAAWDPELRTQPRAVSVLRYQLGDRTRRIYGRPRRFTPVLTNLIFGRVPVVADFARADTLHYDDVEQSVTADLTGSTNPLGISSPVRSPFAATFGLWTAPSRTAVVRGDRPTWPILEFRGGVNPWAEVAGWRCRLLASLNWDEVVVVDTRPWVRSATLRGSYMPLDRGSRLAEMSIPPGNWPVRYGNDSSLGQPSVTVRWRNAHSSL